MCTLLHSREGLEVYNTCKTPAGKKFFPAFLGAKREKTKKNGQSELQFPKYYTNLNISTGLAIKQEKVSIIIPLYYCVRIARCLLVNTFAMKLESYELPEYDGSKGHFELLDHVEEAKVRPRIGNVKYHFRREFGSKK
jgi:hypothetical protein